MQLRPYQSDCVQAVEAGWSEASKQLIVVPTGGGKTILFASLAARRTGRTLILAHREELIGQAVEKIRAATGLEADVEKAERHASRDAKVVVASVQTLQGKRLESWPRDHFTLVVADEAHHALASTWQTVLTHFDGHADVLGVTATPDRGDKRNLGSYFERVAFEISLVDLIQQGFLAPVTIRAVPLKIDLSPVRQTQGDFAAEDLGHALEPFLCDIARAVKEYASGRRTLAFLPLIDTSLKFRDACRRVGLRAEHIDGNDKDRREKLERFSAWGWDVISNAMLLTEGYDDPGIDCVLVLRPTRSRSLYAQMIGRGTRTEPLKENLLILDLLWMHEKHRICRPANLVAQSEEEAESITAEIREASERPGGGEQIELFAAASDAAAKRLEKLKEEIRKHSLKKGKLVTAEEFAAAHDSLALAEYEPTMEWESKEVTEAQARALRRAKIDPATVRGRGHASQILSVVYGMQKLTLASPRQRALLRRMGHPEAERATVQEFRQFMKRVKA